MEYGKTYLFKKNQTFIVNSGYFVPVKDALACIQTKRTAKVDPKSKTNA